MEDGGKEREGARDPQEASLMMGRKTCRWRQMIGCGGHRCSTKKKQTIVSKCDEEKSFYYFCCFQDNAVPQ